MQFRILELAMRTIRLRIFCFFFLGEASITSVKGGALPNGSVPADYHLGVRMRDVWTNGRVRAMASSVRSALEMLREGEEKEGFAPATEDELQQALLWASYPIRITGVRSVVYANKQHSNLALLKDTVPFPLTIFSHDDKEWRGTVDKLLGYWSVLQYVDDDEIVVFLDAFDVFGNGFDGHELLRRYFTFGRPIVISCEENVFPREAGQQAELAVEAMGRLGHVDTSQPSRFLNAGGIIGVAWALRKIYNDMREKMEANNPHNLMDHSDWVGHWFLHAYDQYELWRYFIRHAQNVYAQEEDLLIALDTEQFIFGSTVMRKENWPVLLQNVTPPEHSIDVDTPLIFDAPQSLFEIKDCRARFVGRRHFPLFWHGHGPMKGAWEGLRDRLQILGCFPEQQQMAPRYHDARQEYQ